MVFQAILNDIFTRRLIILLQTFTQRLKLSLASISYKFIQFFLLVQGSLANSNGWTSKFNHTSVTRRKLNIINYVNSLVLNSLCQLYVSGLGLVNFFNPSGIQCCRSPKEKLFWRILRESTQFWQLFYRDFGMTRNYTGTILKALA